MFAAPLSERCALSARDIETCGHIDGIVIRFGPGPEVAIMPPSSHTAGLALFWALQALCLLDETLAKKAVR